MSEIDVVLPVLNEAEALPWVLGRFPAGYRPLVVDNNSSDGSAAVAARLGAEVVSESLPGFGAACHAGLTRARSELVCFMDCDASLDPRNLERVSAPVAAGAADLVVGARVPEPGSWPAHARVANRMLAWWLQRQTGIQISDPGPMRCARRVDLVALAIGDRRFGWPFEMLVRAAAAGWVVAEAPVPYLPRVGRSKVTGTVKGSLRAAIDTARVAR